MTEAKRQSDATHRADGPRILVVDDDITTREILAAMLSDGGYQPTLADSAESALALYEDDPYPVVISDIRMDGMDGIELLKRIKQTSEDTQVIMITAHASLHTSLTSLREGAYDYLIKPIQDFDVVLAVVARALDKVRLVVENRYLFEKLEHSNTELEGANAMLREITLRDGLTGLYNHRYLKESLRMEVQRSMRHKRMFSVLFCDIDYFKQYNDSQGHLYGDDALREFSKLVAERLRTTDIPCRYGGEEFVIVLPETPRGNAEFLAKDICRLVREHPFAGEENQPGGKVTVSIGVAGFPHDADGPEELLSLADKALYLAKKSGRDCVRVCDGFGAEPERKQKTGS